MSRTPRATTPLLLLAMLAILAVAWLLRPTPDALSPAPAVAGATLAAAPRATSGDLVFERHADATALAAPRPRRGLRFVSKSNHQPIAGVKLIAPTPLRTIPLDAPAFAVADDDGIAILPDGDTHDGAIAESRNTLPAAIDLRDLAEVRTVLLQPARELLVFCVDQHGSPVAGCTVAAPMQLWAPVRSGRAAPPAPSPMPRASPVSPACRCCRSASPPAIRACSPTTNT